MNVVLPKKWKFVIAIILIALFLIEILFDPLSSAIVLAENIEAKIGLPIARAKWDKQKITHYKFDIRGAAPSECIFGGNVEVKDNVVIGVGKRSDYDNNPSMRLYTIDPMMYGQSFLCDYRNYTFLMFFDAVEHDTLSEISFDPEYGFVARVRFGYSGRQGLLGPRMGYCCGSFIIENFQPLDR